MSTLLEKRAALITEHQAMERHAPHWKAEAEAGRKISERLIGFQCDDEICVVGECVKKLYAALGRFADSLRADAEQSIERCKSDVAFAHAVSKVQKALASPVPAEVRVNSQTWNAYMLALAEVGVSAVLTAGE